MKTELGLKPPQKGDFVSPRSFLVELFKLKMFFTLDANTSIYNTTESVERVAHSSYRNLQSIKLRVISSNVSTLSLSDIFVNIKCVAVNPSTKKDNGLLKRRRHKSS